MVIPAHILEAQKTCMAQRANAATGATLHGMAHSQLHPIPPLQKLRKLNQHRLRVVTLAWHPDSQHLVSADQHGQVILWDTHTSSVRQYVSRPFATSLAVAPTMDAEDATTIAVGGMDNSITICDMAFSIPKGEPLCVLPGMGDSHDGLISSLAFLGSKDKLISAGGDGDLRIWSVSKAMSAQVIRGHTKDITSMHVLGASGDGAPCIATASVDGTVRLWDLRAGIATHVFHCGPMKGTMNGLGVGPSIEASAVSFFQGGDAVAAGCADGAVRLFDKRSYSMLGEFVEDDASKMPGVAVNGIACSSSGRAMYVSHENATIKCYDSLGSGIPTHKMVAKCEPPMKTHSISAGLCLAPKGDVLGFGSEDGRVHILGPKLAGK